ncbi:MAG: hypothetical protein QMC67_11815 [Candidatus Wallbacteria bacterium]
MKKNIYIYLLIFVMLLLGYSQVIAQQADPDAKTITGKIQKYQGNKDEKIAVYEIVTEAKEHYKIIGPKSIVDQLVSDEFAKNLATAEVVLTGKIIKKDNKQGIIISTFQILDEATKKSGIGVVTMPNDAVPAAAQTKEVTIPKENK